MPPPSGGILVSEELLAPAVDPEAHPAGDWGVKLSEGPPRMLALLDEEGDPNGISLGGVFTEADMP